MTNTVLCAAFGLLAMGGIGVAPLALHRWQTQRLRENCRRQRALVLTYDDGPGRALTLRVLELLAQFGARATFFALGMRAQQHPEIVEQVLAAGHEVGCHGQAHCNAWHVAPWRTVADIRTGYRTLARWIGPAALFRPPCGKITPITWAYLRLRGAPVGWWTVDSGDTRRAVRAPEAVVEAVRRDGGGVVLMHDFDRSPALQARAEHVVETTRQLLEWGQRERFRIKTLGTLLAAPVA